MTASQGVARGLEIVHWIGWASGPPESRAVGRDRSRPSRHLCLVPPRALCSSGLVLSCLAACYAPAGAGVTETDAVTGTTGAADSTADPTTGPGASATADPSSGPSTDPSGGTSSSVTDPTHGDEATTGKRETETDGDRGACDDAQPFTQIVLVDELSTADAEAARV